MEDFMLEKEIIRSKLEKEKLLNLATKGEKHPDNSVVCYAFDDALCLYFGSYSDTLKCKNIAHHNVVAITVGTLQIHGKARLIEYGTKEYHFGRTVYDNRFPQYKEVFAFQENELYKVEPLVIWNYNPSKGEMHRDVLILDDEYYNSLDVYVPHKYQAR